MKSERLTRIFAQAPYETRLMISLMEETIGADTVERVLDDMEKPSVSESITVAGRPLRFYAGMTDEQLSRIGLNADEKLEIQSHFDGTNNSRDIPDDDSSPENPREDGSYGKPEVEKPKAKK